MKLLIVLLLKAISLTQSARTDASHRAHEPTGLGNLNEKPADTIDLLEMRASGGKFSGFGEDDGSLMDATRMYADGAGDEITTRSGRCECRP